jgi:hypothetical protein
MKDKEEAWIEYHSKTDVHTVREQCQLYCNVEKDIFYAGWEKAEEIFNGKK